MERKLALKKIWIAIVVAAAVATFALAGGVAQAHPQPVQQDCLGASHHGGVTPTFTNIGQTSVTVNWDDPCNDEDYFTVFRNGVDVSGPLAAGTTSFTDTGLTCGTTYTYYIVATKELGGGTTDATSTSNSAQVTTAPCGPPAQLDCEGPFDNHGQYVSCVARNESSPPGKGPVVKDAAQSDEGKPNP
jgi:hypothetical protein